jgi:type VI secretion system ImpC/EvpB family protein
MSNGRLDFPFDFGRPQRRPAPGEDAPFRILVIGDFSGGAPLPLAQRAAKRIDLDRFDRVFAELAPRVRVTATAQPAEVTCGSIDDFHPDRLYDRLSLFAALRQLRAELADPALYRRAAAALGAAAPAPAATPVTPAATESASGDIARLLGRAPAAPAGHPAPATAAGSALDQLIRAAVARHVVADTQAEQQRYLAAADRAITEEMRKLLHDPAFQAMEARWRALWRLASGIEDSERVQVLLLDASLAEIAADLAAGAGDLGRTALHQRLAGAETEAPDGQRWSLIVLDHSFAPTDADGVLLAALGTLAARAGAPLVAAASPLAVGAPDAAALARPADWQVPAGSGAAFWQQLRASSVAPSIGLALPRVLERLPYGARTERIDRFDFEELSEAREHGDYLWSNPALSLALLAAHAFEQDGWALDLDSQLELADLPSHSYRDDGEAQQQACAEAYFSDSAAQQILARGLMPLISSRNRNVARLMRWQSIAEPAAPLRGPWGG